MDRKSAAVAAIFVVVLFLTCGASEKFTLDASRIQCHDSVACPLNILRSAQCNVKGDNEWTCDLHRSFNAYSLDSTSESMFDVINVNLVCHAPLNCTLNHSIFIKSFDGLFAVMSYYIMPCILLFLLVIVIGAIVGKICSVCQPMPDKKYV